MEFHPLVQSFLDKNVFVKRIISQLWLTRLGERNHIGPCFYKVNPKNRKIMQMNEEIQVPLEDEEQVRNKMRDNYFYSIQSKIVDIDKFEEDGSGLTIYGDI